MPSPTKTNPGRESWRDDSGTVHRMYDWSEIIAEYADWTNNPAATEDWDASGQAKSFASDSGSWSGATAAKVQDWIANGYNLTPLEGAGAPAALLGERPRWRWSDNPDGDYAHDVFLGGEPDYYLSRDKVGSKPGINIEVSLDFSGSVGAEILAQYGEWSGTAIRAVQAQGYDVSVCVTCESTGSYSEEARSAAHIQVSRFGKVNLQSDWSALFSPGGFRHLMFVAIILPGKEAGLHVDYSLGRPINNPRWRVEYDPDSRTLKFGCNSSGGRFNPDDMTEQLRKVQAGF